MALAVRPRSSLDDQTLKEQLYYSDPSTHRRIHPAIATLAYIVNGYRHCVPSSVYSHAVGFAQAYFHIQNDDGEHEIVRYEVRNKPRPNWKMHNDSVLIHGPNAADFKRHGGSALSGVSDLDFSYVPGDTA